MNYLKQALEHCGVRLSYDDKWLVIDVSTGYYEVYQRKYGKKITRKLCSTENEEDAVGKLLEADICNI